MPSKANKKKGFDCVAYTRQQRDRIDREIAGLSYEERIQWFLSKRYSDPTLERLASGFREDYRKILAEMKANREPGDAPSRRQSSKEAVHEDG